MGATGSEKRCHVRCRSGEVVEVEQIGPDDVEQADDRLPERVRQGTVALDDGNESVGSDRTDIVVGISYAFDDEGESEGEDCAVERREDSEDVLQTEQHAVVDFPVYFEGSRGWREGGRGGREGAPRGARIHNGNG
jgi:hypothetical protein